MPTRSPPTGRSEGIPAPIDIKLLRLPVRAFGDTTIYASLHTSCVKLLAAFPNGKIVPQTRCCIPASHLSYISVYIHPRVLLHWTSLPSLDICFQYNIHWLLPTSLPKPNTHRPCSDQRMMKLLRLPKSLLISWHYCNLKRRYGIWWNLESLCVLRIPIYSNHS
jgi:hypothetical protein